MGIGHAGLKLSSSLKLKVGGRYKSNRGYEIFIVSRTGNLKYPFVSACGFTYSEDGKFDLDDSQTYEDLIEEVIDIASGPKIKLEVGKTYYTRNGGLAKNIIYLGDKNIYSFSAEVHGRLFTYTENGTHNTLKSNSPLDIVKEVPILSEGRMNFELQDLIDKANAGLEALEALTAKQSNIVNSLDRNVPDAGNFYRIPLNVEQLCRGMRYKIKSPLRIHLGEVGGYSIIFDNDNKTVSIGCKTFPADALLHRLLFLNDKAYNSISASDALVLPITSSRKGPTDGENTISWEDSDKIIDLLTKAGV